MSQVLRFIGKSVDKVFGGNKQKKEEEFKKNLQFIPAGNNFEEVVVHSKPKVEENQNSRGGNQR